MKNQDEFGNLSDAINNIVGILSSANRQELRKHLVVMANVKGIVKRLENKFTGLIGAIDETLKVEREEEVKVRKAESIAIKAVAAQEAKEAKEKREAEKKAEAKKPKVKTTK